MEIGDKVRDYCLAGILAAGVYSGVQAADTNFYLTIKDTIVDRPIAPKKVPGYNITATNLSVGTNYVFEKTLNMKNWTRLGTLTATNQMLSIKDEKSTGFVAYRVRKE